GGRDSEEGGRRFEGRMKREERKISATSIYFESMTDKLDVITKLEPNV
uniref:Uncharacterized protein n=1 Tax=Oncorhynchus tshawytscha TaxID=74940 RepID=A0A8C8C1P5_ONCTS